MRVDVADFLSTNFCADQRPLDRQTQAKALRVRPGQVIAIAGHAEAGNAREGMAAFDVAEVARDVAELYEPVAEEADIALTVDVAGEPEGVQVVGSRELVGQALANLVDNALKYAPAGEDPALHASITVSAARRGETVELVVADRGPGIPAEDRARVREELVQSRRLAAQTVHSLNMAAIDLHAALGTLPVPTVELPERNW